MAKHRSGALWRKDARVALHSGQPFPDRSGNYTENAAVHGDRIPPTVRGSHRTTARQRDWPSP